MARLTGFGQGRFFRWALALFGAGLLAAGGVAAQATGISAARYDLTIDGHTLATFTELEVIASTATLPATTGSGLPTVSAGRAVTQVVLRRAMTRNIELAVWHELVILGDVASARKNCSLVMYDSRGQPVARYHLTDAWPQKLEIGALKAGGSEVLMETVTMAAEFIQRVSI